MTTNYVARIQNFAQTITAITLMSATSYAGSNAGIMYHGRIADSSNTPVTDTSASFQIKIIGKSTLKGDGTALSEKCTLYSETQTLNLSTTNGTFSISIGEGTSPTFGTGVTTLEKVFINPPVDLTAPASTAYAIPAVSCVSGATTYLPNSASNDREIEVSVTLTNGTSLNLGSMAIRSAPFAMQAKEIGGYTSNDLLKVGSASSATYRVMTTGQADYLIGLLDETSDFMDAQTKKIRNVTTPLVSEPDAAANVAYVTAAIAASGVGTGDITDVTAGTGLTGTAASGNATIGLANIADDRIMANVSGGAAAPSETTITALLDGVVGNAQGTMMYRNGTTWTALAPGTSGQFLKTQGAGANPIWDADNNSGGSVTSVDLTVPSFLSVSGGPINSSGTFAVSLASQTGNVVFASPADGSGAAPTFRSLAAADIPNLSAAKITSGTLAVAQGGTGVGTLSGYGILTMNAAGNAVTSTLCTTTGEVLKYNSITGAWACGTDADSGGDITGVTAGTGLTGTASSGDPTISLANIDDDRIMANVSGSSAAPSATTITALLDGVVSNAQGTMMYRNGTTWTALAPGTSGQFLKTQGAGANPIWDADNNSGGSVTSVAMTVPTFLSVSGGPVTASGTLAVSLANQTGNVVFASPVDGSSAAPTFRSLAAADIPNLSAAKITSGTLAVAQGGTGAGTLSGYGILTMNSAGNAVTSTLCTTTGQVLKYNSISGSWACGTDADSGGDITGVTAGTGLTGTFSSGSGTIGLADIADDRVMANTSGSSAAPVATTVSVLLDNAVGNTRGSLLIRDNTGWVPLTPGTSGHVLTSGGAGADLSWAAGAAGDITTVAAGSGLTGGGTSGNVTLAVDWASPGSIGASTANAGAFTTLSSSGTYTATGNISQTGATTFGTGTGAVSLNGDVTIAAGRNLSMASGAGTFVQTYTGTTTDAAQITANSVTSADVLQLSGNGLTSGNILNISSSSTAAAAGNTGINVAISGVNGTSGITRTGISSTVTASSGGTSTNVAASFSASGGTNNYAVLVPSGNVGIGTSSPTSKLHVSGGAIVSDSTSASTASFVNFGAGNVAYSSTATTTITVCGMKDGGSYTLALTGLTAAQTITVVAYPTYVNSTSCSGTAHTVNLGSAATTFTSAGTTNIVTFIYLAGIGANGTVYGSVMTGF